MNFIFTMLWRFCPWNVELLDLDFFRHKIYEIYKEVNLFCFVVDGTSEFLCYVVFKEIVCLYILLFIFLKIWIVTVLIFRMILGHSGQRSLRGSLIVRGTYQVYSRLRHFTSNTLPPIIIKFCKKISRTFLWLPKIKLGSWLN